MLPISELSSLRSGVKYFLKKLDTNMETEVIYCFRKCDDDEVG